MKKIMKLGLVSMFLVVMLAVTITPVKVEAIITTPTPINVIFTDSKIREQVSLILTKSQSATVTQDDLDSITSLTATRVGSLAGLQHLRNLQSLDCQSGTISNLTPLADLNNLKNVNLSLNSISDISALANKAELESLKIKAEYGAQKISDISPLANNNKLVELDFTYNEISDLSVLANKTELKTLLLMGNKIEDISALSNLTGVETLDLAANKLVEITNLANLSNLVNLNLSGTQISDISPLSNKLNLATLQLSGNQIVDISSLADSTNMQRIVIDGNQIVDISALTNMTNLEYVSIARNPIVDITALSDKRKLKELLFFTTQVADLTPLANCENLEIMYAMNNQITNVEPLSNLNKLEKLYLSNNPISDVSPLAQPTNLKELYIQNTLVENVDALVQNSTSLESIEADGAKISDIVSILAQFRVVVVMQNQKLDMPACRVNPRMTEVRCDYVEIKGAEGSNIMPVRKIESGTNFTIETSEDGTKLQSVWTLEEATTMKTNNLMLLYDHVRGEELGIYFPDVRLVWSYSAKYTQTFVDAFAVTYDANTGTGTTPYDANYYLPEEDITVLDGSALSKDGFHFVGWSTNPNATVAEYTSGQLMNITADTTLYAVWKEGPLVKFIVTYHANTGNGTVPIDTSQYNLSDVVDVLHNGTLFKNNHQFLGWSTNPNDTVPQFFTGDQITITSNVDLYAIWQATPSPITPEGLPKTGSQDILVLTTLIAFAMYGSRKFIKQS